MIPLCLLELSSFHFRCRNIMMNFSCPELRMDIYRMVFRKTLRHENLRINVRRFSVQPGPGCVSLCQVTLMNKLPCCNCREKSNKCVLETI